MSKKKSRYQILEIKLGNSKRIVRSVETSFRGLENYDAKGNQGDLRRDDILDGTAIAVLHHLGYAVNISVKSRIRETLEVAEDFFCGDWWRTATYYKASPAGKKGAFRHGWVQSYSCAVILCLLTDNRDLLRSISDELDSSLKDVSVIFEPPEADVYLSLAGHFRGKPMEGIDRVEKRLSKCRIRRSRMFFDAWSAMRSGRQEQFEEAFMRLIDDYIEMPHKESSFLTVFARSETILALLAPEFKMRLPELNEKHRASLLTPASVGL